MWGLREQSGSQGDEGQEEKAPGAHELNLQKAIIQSWNIPQSRASTLQSRDSILPASVGRTIVAFSIRCIRY
jgi:hypothetical protein